MLSVFFFLCCSVAVVVISFLLRTDVHRKKKHTKYISTNMRAVRIPQRIKRVKRTALTTELYAAHMNGACVPVYMYIALWPVPFA